MRDYNFKLHWNTAYKNSVKENLGWFEDDISETCLLYTSPSPRDRG